MGASCDGGAQEFKLFVRATLPSLLAEQSQSEFIYFSRPYGRETLVQSQLHDRREIDQRYVALATTKASVLSEHPE